MARFQTLDINNIQHLFNIENRDGFISVPRGTAYYYLAPTLPDETMDILDDGLLFRKVFTNIGWNSTANCNGKILTTNIPDADIIALSDNSPFSGEGSFTIEVGVYGSRQSPDAVEFATFLLTCIDGNITYSMKSRTETYIFSHGFGSQTYGLQVRLIPKLSTFSFI